MAEVPAAAVSKLYLSDKPDLTLSVSVDGALDTIFFSRGRFVTAKAHEQDAIEACELFRSQHVRVAPAPDPRDALLAQVDATAAGAKTAADAAGKAAAEVEAFLNRPKVLAAAASKAAAAALTAYDKAQIPAPAAPVVPAVPA